MALKGSYDYKGITVSDAYVKIVSVSYSTSEHVTNQIKTAAVYNSDGSIKTDAVYEDVVSKACPASFTAKIWKDKAVRDTKRKFDDQLTSVHGSFEMNVAADAKNPVIQAYVAMKLLDAWKDYTNA